MAELGRLGDSDTADLVQIMETHLPGSAPAG